MANTYTLIASNTLGSDTAAVDFTSIPNTYTDLLVKCSVRADNASTFREMRIKLNNDTNSNYSSTRLMGDGASATSSINSSVTYWPEIRIDAATATSNTFANLELYIPNYASTTDYKPSSLFSAHEDNATTAYLRALANLYISTNLAISQIGFYFSGTVKFVSGSSFFLYGIKNS